MNGLTSLQEALLELGLEDWIALPEILETPEVRPFAGGSTAVGPVAEALVDLLARGVIQVWSGRWSDDPKPVPRALAVGLLRDDRRYSYGAEDAGLDRVYFVNVANFRAAE